MMAGKSRGRSLRAACCTGALLAAALWPVAPAAQTTGGQVPRLTIESTDGRDVFDVYCATCHGRDGRGDGPVAASLKTPPPDLTLLARRNGGTFPAVVLRHVLLGTADRPLPAHGTREMPVWGPIFLALDPDETRATLRIERLLAYIESLQAKWARNGSEE